MIKFHLYYFNSKRRKQINKTLTAVNQLALTNGMRLKDATNICKTYESFHLCVLNCAHFE